MNDLPYGFTLTEEIARWVFEVHVIANERAHTNWRIIFSNPTAGPWKRVATTDASGTVVELLRFKREEERPDIVLLSDALRIILIVEAKDSLGNLLRSDQLRKSLSTVREVGSALSKVDNPVWRPRRTYVVTPAFLWPGTSPDREWTLLEQAYDADSRSLLEKGALGICITRSTQRLLPVLVGRAGRDLNLGVVKQSLDL